MKRRRYVRFTRWRRAHFFRVLEETGHAQAAAEAAGVSLACIYRLRRVEPGFVDRMEAARARADGRLGRDMSTGDHATRRDSPSPNLSPEGERDSTFVVRRGIGGRRRLIAAGARWWSARDDAVFLSRLRVTGNVAGSARAAGFCPKTAWNQRARRPAFARAWDQAAEEAEVHIEWRVLKEAMARVELPDADAETEAEADRNFDLWPALWYLKWRERRERRR